MPNDQLRKALLEQEKELEELDEQLSKMRPIQSRRDNLYQLVAQMRFMLGMEPYRPAAAPPEERAEATPSGREEQRPIWAMAREVIEKSGVPMSPGEIANVLRGLGFPQLVGRPGKETVRTLLVKKKEIFTKLQDGRFELRKQG